MPMVWLSDQVKPFEHCGLCGTRSRTPLFGQKKQTPIERDWSSVAHIVNCNYKRTHQVLGFDFLWFSNKLKSDTFWSLYLSHNVDPIPSKELKKTSSQQCLVCRRVVASNKSMRLHSVLHVLPREELFSNEDIIKCRLKCTGCQNTCKHGFRSRAELAEHIAEEHFMVGSDYIVDRAPCKLKLLKLFV